jgi:hypothetical protein
MATGLKSFAEVWKCKNDDCATCARYNMVQDVWDASASLLTLQGDRAG